MISRILKLIVVILLVTSAVPGGAAEFEYGARPKLQVFDPSGFLKPEMVREISGPLETYYQKEGIDVLVIILPDIGSAPPEHVVGRFADAWCGPAIRCVVLHVPGRGDGPWIVPSGRLIEHIAPEQISQAVGNARRRVASEPKGPDKVKAAATEAADMLRYWMAQAISHSETRLTEIARIRGEQQTKARQWKIAVIAGVASIIPLCAGISVLMIFLRNRGPGHFPNQTWRLRLGAPYAGGNRAVADLGPPLP
jgi:hypothetical protein